MLTISGLACVVVPEALVEELAVLRISFANLTCSFEEEVKKSPESQEKFVKLLSRLFCKTIDDCRSYFEILVEEELSFFNTHYLKQLCTTFPEDVR